MEDIYAEIIKALEKREKLALATLITRVGSAPRGVGAKYLIREDGSSFGSIGGGCVVIASGGERQSASKALECGSFRLWEIADCTKLSVFMPVARLNPDG